MQQLLSDNLFLLSNSPRPVRVEFALYDASIDDDEGAPVAPKLVEPPPLFAQPGTLEFDFALKWRELALAHKAEEERLHELHRQEREILRLGNRLDLVVGTPGRMADLMRDQTLRMATVRFPPPVSSRD